MRGTANVVARSGTLSVRNSEFYQIICVLILSSYRLRTDILGIGIGDIIYIDCHIRWQIANDFGIICIRIAVKGFVNILGIRHKTAWCLRNSELQNIRVKVGNGSNGRYGIDTIRIFEINIGAIVVEEPSIGIAIVQIVKDKVACVGSCDIHHQEISACVVRSASMEAFE